jgi:hypothetical protein
MTSISVNPLDLDLVIITELDLTENIAAHDQLLIGLRAAQADFVRSRLAAGEDEQVRHIRLGAGRQHWLVRVVEFLRIVLKANSLFVDIEFELESFREVSQSVQVVARYTPNSRP